MHAGCDSDSSPDIMSDDSDLEDECSQMSFESVCGSKSDTSRTCEEASIGGKSPFTPLYDNADITIIESFVSIFITAQPN